MIDVHADIIFISDFFLGEVRGGAEFCNDALIHLLIPDVKIAFKITNSDPRICHQQ